jgi:hypothetical protein
MPLALEIGARGQTMAWPRRSRRPRPARCRHAARLGRRGVRRPADEPMLIVALLASGYSFQASVALH